MKIIGQNSNGIRCVAIPVSYTHLDVYKRQKEQTLFVEIEDFGKGIEDVEKAMEPLFTTKAEAERSGMGFSFMEAFMDSLEVESTPGKGTLVKMSKIIGKGRKIWTTQSL